MWTGVSDDQTRFVVTSEREAIAAECINLMGQIVTLRYATDDDNGNNEYWNWFMMGHKQQMAKLRNNPTSGKCVLEDNNPLVALHKATSDMSNEQLAEIDDDNSLCLISGLNHRFVLENILHIGST